MSVSINRSLITCVRFGTVSEVLLWITVDVVCVLSSWFFFFDLGN